MEVSDGQLNAIKNLSQQRRKVNIVERSEDMFDNLIHKHEDINLFKNQNTASDQT